MKVFNSLKSLFKSDQTPATAESGPTNQSSNDPERFRDRFIRPVQSFSDRAGIGFDGLRTAVFVLQGGATVVGAVAVGSLAAMFVPAITPVGLVAAAILGGGIGFIAMGKKLRVI